MGPPKWTAATRPASSVKGRTDAARFRANWSSKRPARTSSARSLSQSGQACAVAAAPHIATAAAMEMAEDFRMTAVLVMRSAVNVKRA